MTTRTTYKTYIIPNPRVTERLMHPRTSITERRYKEVKRRNEMSRMKKRGVTEIIPGVGPLTAWVVNAITTVIM